MRIVCTIAFSMLVTGLILTPAGCGGVNWDELGAKQDQETLGPINRVFGDAYYYVFDESAGIYTLYNGKRKKIGYAFYAKGRGYIGDINILVGLKDKKTIKGILVTSQNETDQYWRFVADSNFFLQFHGLAIEWCYVNDYSGNGGRVDSVSGATTSAMAIIDAVRETAIARVKLMS